MKESRLLKALVCLLVSSVPLAAADVEDESQLTVDRLFASKDFDPEPFGAQWLKDGSAYVTLESSPQKSGGKDIVAHDPVTGRREVLVPADQLVPPGESSPLTIEGYSFSADRSLVLIYTNSKRVWRRKTRGDYWVLDRAGHELHQLGGDAKPSTLMFAKLSPTGHHVAYVREKNIYLEDLRSREIVQLTDAESPEIIHGTFDWVYEEEFGLRDGFAWSPDGARIAYWQIDTRGVREFALVNYTDGLYPKFLRFKYPKTGQRNSACRLGVVDIATQESRWLDVPGDPRNHYIARMNWAKNSDEVYLQQLNRLQNTDHVMLADAKTGKATTIFTDRDDAWIDTRDNILWMSDGKQFAWLSERDGWRHAYLVSRSGESVELVTPGEFDVISMSAIDEKRGWLYFFASPDNATQKYLYRVRLDGTGRERVTPSDQPGWHDYQISSDCRWAIHQWSSFASPPQIELVELPQYKVIRPLVENEKLRERLGKLRRAPSEFFQVDIGEDVLDAWCILPPQLDKQKKYPLLVYVYGEPAGQTVLDRWGGKGYLWHLMLAQRGYVVMSVDNRGTPAPRGRAWRKSIYRQVGIQAPADQAAAVKQVLAERSYIDGERVGVWGWSGGGSMSLHAIFRHPDLYKTAMSIAPVPNERYYDTIYQERYMGLPGDNVEGYLKGSPIHYAKQLEGNLLLIHGTGDDNCHYQGTECLINELIKHNKHFTMMAYPNRTHSIKEGPNTTRHLRGLLTRYLTENLPPGPR